MNKAIFILKRFALLFIIPYVEVVFLRYVISKDAIYQYLDLIFSPGKIFYSLIPIGIAFVVFMLLLDKKESPLMIELQKKTALVNAVFLILFLSVSLNLQFLHDALGRQSLSFVWYTLGLITFASSFLIMFDLKSFLQRIFKLPGEFVFSIFAGSLFYFFHLSIHYFWRYLSRSVTLIVYLLLKFLGYDMTFGEDGTTLSHPLFAATVGPACSGLEGIFLFLFLFSLVLFVDWGRYTVKRAAAIYLLGILYMYSLNLLRVTIFFIAAVWATQKWGESEASHLFVWFFHANVGWIFYLIGIMIFFAILFQNEKNRKLLPKTA